MFPISAVNMLALVGISAAASAQHVTIERFEHPASTMGERAAEQVAADLALSEPQRALWLRMVREYHEHFAEADAARRDEDEKWFTAFWLERFPELDDSVDISGLPDDEQAEISEMRADWKRGQPPYMKQSFDDVMSRAERKYESEGAMHHLERELRRGMLERLRAMLADEQLERWPVAVRRLTINLEDEQGEDRYAGSDPVWHVDLLGMLREATEEDGELHEIAEPIRHPDIVLLDAKAGEAIVKLAERILAFEQEYAGTLHDYAWKAFQFGHEIIRLRQQREIEAVEQVTMKQRDVDRRVWDVRLRFVEDLGAIAGEFLGDAVREAWEQRWRQRFCPTLYLEESTDAAIEYVRAIDALDDDVLAAAELIYAEHNAWRQRFKARMVRRLIDYRVQTEARKKATGRDLAEAYETRWERAKQVNQSLGRLLPPEYSEPLEKHLRGRMDSQTMIGGRFVHLRP